MSIYGCPTIQHEWRLWCKKIKKKLLPRRLAGRLQKNELKKDWLRKMLQKVEYRNEQVSRIERGTVSQCRQAGWTRWDFECGTDELLIESRLRSMDHAKYLYELFERLNEQDKALLLHLMTTLAERLGPDNSCPISWHRTRKNGCSKIRVIPKIGDRWNPVFQYCASCLIHWVILIELEIRTSEKEPPSRYADEHAGNGSSKC